jgi:hypothetical protein
LHAGPRFWRDAVFTGDAWLTTSGVAPAAPAMGCARSCLPG